MRKKNIIILISAISLLFFYNHALCLDTKDVVKLTEAGISSETIHVIIKEKIIETCAYTVQEIVELKKAGLSNKTIQMAIEGASYMKDTGTIEYAKGMRRIKSITVKDIIDLKKEGISDEVIQSIVAGATDLDDAEQRRAWKMLENMGIIFDDR